MPINPGNVVRLLFEKFGNNAETPIKFAERELCQQLSGNWINGFTSFSM